MSAGQLRERVVLESPFEIDDGAGNYTNGFQAQTPPLPARIRYLKGREEVLAGRLAGVQPVEIRIRNSINVAAVRTDWRVVDPRAGQDEFGKPALVLNIRSIIITERGDYIDLLCEKGVAT